MKPYYCGARRSHFTLPTQRHHEGVTNTRYKTTKQNGHPLIRMQHFRGSSLPQIIKRGPTYTCVYVDFSVFWYSSQPTGNKIISRSMTLVHGLGDVFLVAESDEIQTIMELRDDQEQSRFQMLVFFARRLADISFIREHKAWSLTRTKRSAKQKHQSSHRTGKKPFSLLLPPNKKAIIGIANDFKSLFG